MPRAQLGKDKQQRKLAAEFVEYILQRAREAGEEVYEKAAKIIEEGRARDSLTLKDFEMEVEVNGEKYKVKVIGGEAVEEDRGGRKLLRIKITAEVGRVEGEHTIVDRVVREYTITFGRYGRDNTAKGFASHLTILQFGPSSFTTPAIDGLSSLATSLWRPPARRSGRSRLGAPCNILSLSGLSSCGLLSAPRP
jgi:hypothetical protein